MIAFPVRVASRVGVLVAAAGCAFGCNFIIEPDRLQCETDADCTKRGAAFAGSVCVASMCQLPSLDSDAGEDATDPLWPCLSGPGPVPAGPGPFNVTIHAQGILDSAPIADASVKLCRKIDVDCQDPETPPDVKTDANGDVQLQIRGGFSGYVAIAKEVAPPDEPLVPGNYFFNPAINSDLNVSVQMATVGLRGALTTLVEATQQDDRGLILLNALNCDSGPAAGITYKSTGADDATRTFYVVEGLPNASVSSTDASGFGGFINIKPGTIAVTGEVLETGRQIDTISLTVKPGVITYSRLVPSGQQ